ncbi:NUDIX hydrolase [Falsibacillus pallidus]|uniref:NUDIX hydrolase n=1 Tax=Falsibacillus pallidus TaxID=493781 RepID=UPI003D997054
MFVNVRAIIVRKEADVEKVLIQRRMKSYEGSTPYEFPGGRLEEFESMINGLKREVMEETGLEIDAFLDELDITYSSSSDHSKVECVKPFAVYQTLKGPVDSMGVYFRCTAKGSLLENGDDTADIHWCSLGELEKLVGSGQFCWVDEAGANFYINMMKNK